MFWNVLIFLNYAMFFKQFVFTRTLISCNCLINFLLWQSINYLRFHAVLTSKRSFIKSISIRPIKSKAPKVKLPATQKRPLKYNISNMYNKITKCPITSTRTTTKYLQEYSVIFAHASRLLRSLIWVNLKNIL